MFGGSGLYRDGVMFGLVSGGEIFLKSDEGTVPRFRAAGSRPFVYAKGGKETTMSHWSLPTEALDDSDELKRWAELAFQAALRAPKARKRR
jgi:DNA transformation protein